MKNRNMKSWRILILNDPLCIYAIRLNFISNSIMDTITLNLNIFILSFFWDST